MCGRTAAVQKGLQKNIECYHVSNHIEIFKGRLFVMKRKVVNLCMVLCGVLLVSFFSYFKADAYVKNG